MIAEIKFNNIVISPIPEKDIKDGICLIFDKDLGPNMGNKAFCDITFGQAEYLLPEMITGHEDCKIIEILLPSLN